MIQEHSGDGVIEGVWVIVCVLVGVNEFVGVIEGVWVIVSVTIGVGVIVDVIVLVIEGVGVIVFVIDGVGVGDETTWLQSNNSPVLILKQYWQGPPNQYGDGTITVISSTNNESGKILSLCDGISQIYKPELLNWCNRRFVRFKQEVYSPPEISIGPTVTADIDGQIVETVGVGVGVTILIS